jgi:hypothetical protein
MKRAILRIFSIILICTILASCNSQESVTESEEETTTSQTVEQVTETITETTEETVSEIIPWAEENEIIMAGQLEEFEIPLMHAVTLNEEIIDEIGWFEQSGIYTAPEIYVSEPDEDGYVEYIINYTVDDEMSVLIPYDVTETTDGWYSNITEYYLVDYYTGMVLAGSGDYHLGEWNTTNVEYDGSVIDISVMGSIEENYISNESSNVDYDNWLWTIERETDFVLTVKAPASYDGLVLYIDLNGETTAPNNLNPEYEHGAPHVLGTGEGEEDGNYWYALLSDNAILMSLDVDDEFDSSTEETENTTFSVVSESTVSEVTTVPTEATATEDPYQWMYDDEASAEVIED